MCERLEEMTSTQMRVGSVVGPHSLSHSQELLLARGKLLEPLLREIVMRIVLEQQHMLSIVTKEGMTTACGSVAASTVPDLAVEDQYAARSCFWLENVGNLPPLRG